MFDQNAMITFLPIRLGRIYARVKDIMLLLDNSYKANQVVYLAVNISDHFFSSINNSITIKFFKRWPFIQAFHYE